MFSATNDSYLFIWLSVNTYVFVHFCFYSTCGKIVAPFWQGYVKLKSHPQHVASPSRCRLISRKRRRWGLTNSSGFVVHIWPCMEGMQELQNRQEQENFEYRRTGHCRQVLRTSFQKARSWRAQEVVFFLKFEPASRKCYLMPRRRTSFDHALRDELLQQKPISKRGSYRPQFTWRQL